MKPIIYSFSEAIVYSFPDGYPHGLKKDDFMEWLSKEWIHGDSNYEDCIFDLYECLGGETDCNEDGFIVDYDLVLYAQAEQIVLKKYLHDETDWQEDYWKKYLSDYEYPYFIGDGEPI